MKTLKRTLYIGMLCVPFYAGANVKQQDTIEVIDLDKITITETGGDKRQVIESSEQNLGEQTTKRVVSKKSNLSDAQKKKFNIAAEELVADAYFVLQKVNTYPFYTELQQKLSTAKAIIIFPSLLKASFFFGLGGGDGMLLVRDMDNNWSYPSFYNTSKAGIGLQFGVSSNSTITIIQNQKALDEILNHQFKIEAGMDAAVGEVGDGQAFSFSKSVHTYSMNKGASIGISFDGQSLMQKAELNQAYYGGGGANTQTIIYDRVFTNPNADKLRQILNAL